MNSGSEILSRIHKRAYGISIHLKAESGLEIEGLQVALKKKSVSVINTIPKASSPEDFCKNINRTDPIFICINGKGLLQRTIPESSLMNGSFFSEYFSQARPDDFYYQTYRLTGDQSSVQVIRKSYLDEVIAYFIAQKYPICGVFLGNDILTVLSGFLLTDFKNTVKGIGYRLEFENGELAGILRSDEIPDDQNLNLDGFELNIPLQLAFSAGINSFMHDDNLNSPDIKEVEQIRKSFITKSVRKLSLLITIAFYFTLLCINTYLNMSFKTELEGIETIVSQNELLLDEIESLTGDISVKQGLLKYSNSDQSPVSFYSDRIASVIPPSVLLDELIVFPVAEEDKSTAFSFDFDSMLIKGRLKRSNEINELIKKLKSLIWVDEVKLESLTEVKAENLFAIKLSLK